MPRKKQSSSRSRKKSTTAKRVVRRTVRRTTPIALTAPREVVRRRRVVEVETPEPTVDTVVTETDFVTEPKVEIRRPATLAQALTEPANIVMKPETHAIKRVTKVKRNKRAA
jgi:hypothetical protein